MFIKYVSTSLGAQLTVGVLSTTLHWVWKVFNACCFITIVAVKLMVAKIHLAFPKSFPVVCEVGATQIPPRG